MPTTKPRLALTLEPELYATLMKLAKLQKRPASAIVSEMLGMLAEPLRRVVSLHEMAASASQEVRSGLVDVAERAESVAIGLTALLDNQLDFLDLLVASPGGGDGSPVVVAESDGGGPPPTNRGVRSLPSGSKPKTKPKSLPSSLPSPSPRKRARNGNG